MVILKLKLGKGERLPKIQSDRIRRVDGKCPNCEETFTIWLCQNFKNKFKYFKGECWSCGYSFLMTPKECELIQPDSYLFEIYYGFHPDRDIERKAKIKKFEDEQRKAALEKKYDIQSKRQFIPGRSVIETKLKPWEKKVIKDVVLEGKDYGRK